MIIEYKQKGTYLIGTIIFSLIPDIVICIAVSVYYDFGILEFVLTLLGLQVVYFEFWLKASVWRWVHFKFRGKKIMADFMEDSLKTNKFPAPQDFENSIEEYLNSVSENEDLDPIIRIKAGRELGIIQYLTASQQAQERLTLTIAYEEALSNYKKYLELCGSGPQATDTSGL